ncbi:hypothetical protein pipiens_016409 [Culex pipiens pipiens]|uniref:Uncharacterized protein n=1 Tax=Culex pipiens pipiens TaxID=38569 RepID=A0ABD1CLF1_CULPP
MDSNWNLLVSADAQKTVKYDEEPGRAWPAALNATSDLLAILGVKQNVMLASFDGTFTPTARGIPSYF